MGEWVESGCGAGGITLNMSVIERNGLPSGSDASSGDDEQRWNGKVNFCRQFAAGKPR